MIQVILDQQHYNWSIEIFYIGFEKRTFSVFDEKQSILKGFTLGMSGTFEIKLTLHILLVQQNETKYHLL